MAQAAERIAKFREEYSDHTIQTELITDHGEIVIMKATISDSEGIVATGYAAEHVARDLNLEVDGFIQKPYSISSLSTKIQKILSGK